MGTLGAAEMIVILLMGLLAGPGSLVKLLVFVAFGFSMR